jgi:hypothetical protein
VATTGIPAAVDEPRLRVSLTSHGRPVFIGIARTADVNAYLAGAAIDKVTDFDVDGRFAITVPHLFWIGIGFISTAAVTLVAA